MDRVRRAGTTALFVLVAASLLAPGSGAEPPSRGPATLAAAVAWPVSTLLVSEVTTGGASASDEFAELTNAGSVAVDLTGFELAYATATGGTITRKAAWTTPTILDPGRHLLVANASGIYASVADVTYSGGFAATGGAVLLRPIGGTPTDAVGWGDAIKRVRGGFAGLRAGGWREHRAVARRVTRQRPRYERQHCGLRRPDRADATEPRGPTDADRSSRSVLGTAVTVRVCGAVCIASSEPHAASDARASPSASAAPSPSPSPSRAHAQPEPTDPARPAPARRPARARARRRRPA